jgi:acyl carrier protein
MNKPEFLRAIDELLELSPGTLKGPEKLAAYDTWDSLAVISLIALADEKFGVVVGSDKIAEAKSVDDLANLFMTQTAAA